MIRTTLLVVMTLINLYLVAYGLAHLAAGRNVPPRVFMATAVALTATSYLAVT